MFKRNRITPESAKSALREYKKIPIQFIEVSLSEALAIAYELNIYAYDAYFLDCAIRSKASLLSIDKTLLEKAEQIGISVKEILP